MTNSSFMAAQQPRVSVVLTTRDRPQFYALALRCFASQAYAQRELIVVDDGSVSPVNEADVTALDGRLIRVPSGTPLGTKLNLGADAASGTLIMKMDDDDWYGPSYVDTMVAGWLESQKIVCRPAIAFFHGFLFFELPRWEIVEYTGNNVPGATLFYSKADWRERPFRPISAGEDVWFLRDQMAAGRIALPIYARESYVAVRHTGSTGDRGHTWTHQGDGQTMEAYLNGRTIFSKTPEEMFPDWALETYRVMHQRLVAAAAP